MELSKGMLPADALSQYDGGSMINNGGAIQEENEMLETDNYTPNPQQFRGDVLGLNPLNYLGHQGSSSVEDEVQMDLLNAQHQRQFNIKAP